MKDMEQDVTKRQGEVSDNTPVAFHIGRASAVDDLDKQGTKVEFKSVKGKILQGVAKMFGFKIEMRALDAGDLAGLGMAAESAQV